MTSRRDFLLTGALALGGMALGGSIQAREPIVRKAKSGIKVGCCSYSYRKYISGKDATMTLETFMDTAADMGCAGVEIADYYFPPDWNQDYICKLRRYALLSGLEINSFVIRCNLALPPGAQRDAELAKVKEGIEHAADVGAPSLRLLAGTSKGEPSDDILQNVADCLDECAGPASKRGIVLSVENHGNLPGTGDQAVSIMKRVKSDWVGMNLDTGNYHTEDPYADIAKTAPYATTVHYKCEVAEAGKPKHPADLKRIVGILKNAGYRGYMNLEYEAAGEPKTEIPKLIQSMKEAVA